MTSDAVIQPVMPCYGTVVPPVMFDLAELRAYRSAAYRMKKPLWRNWNWADEVRNHLTRVALEDSEVTHVLYTEHDHDGVPENAAERLLAHGLPVVGALYFQRTHPFEVVAGDLHPDGHHVAFLKRPPAGLQRVDWAGLGMLLVEAKVLRRVAVEFKDTFWFRYQGDGGRPDDLWFFNRLRACGVPVHVDGSLRIGHVAYTTVNDKAWEATHG